MVAGSYAVGAKLEVSTNGSRSIRCEAGISGGGSPTNLTPRRFEAGSDTVAADFVKLTAIKVTDVVSD